MLMVIVVLTIIVVTVTTIIRKSVQVSHISTITEIHSELRKAFGIQQASAYRTITLKKKYILRAKCTYNTWLSNCLKIRFNKASFRRLNLSCVWARYH